MFCKDNGQVQEIVLCAFKPQLMSKSCQTHLVPTVRSNLLLRVISAFITLSPPEMKSGFDLREVFPQEENFKGAFFNHIICMCFWFLHLPKLIINNVKCASWLDRDHSMQWQCHQLWPWMPHDRWRVCVRLSWGIFTTGQWRRLHWYGL